MVSSQPVIRKEGGQYEVMLFYDKRPWNEKYIYLISLKQPIDIPRLSSFNSGFKPFGKIRDDMIQDLLLIHNPKLFSEPFKHNPKEPLTRDMIDGIWEFHNGGKRRIPPTVIQKFKNGMYHEQFPMKLYRGLKMDNLQPLQVSLGDTIYLPSEKISSWTTNICVAEKYSMFKGHNGLVVSSIIPSEKMIVDTRFIARTDLDKYNIKDNNTIFWPYQNEILVEPGNYDMYVEKILFTEGDPNHIYERYPNSYIRDDMTTGWDQYKDPSSKNQIRLKSPNRLKSPIRLKSPNHKAKRECSSSSRHKNRWTRDELVALANQRGIHVGKKTINDLCMLLHINDSLKPAAPVPPVSRKRISPKPASPKPASPKPASAKQICVCKAILKSGVRKNEMCGKPCKQGEYCGIHKR
jgi:hypothetical protein